MLFDRTSYIHLDYRLEKEYNLNILNQFKNINKVMVYTSIKLKRDSSVLEGDKLFYRLSYFGN